MFRTCLLASVAAFALAVPPASALTPVAISEIDTSGDGNLSVGEMRAAGMNPFLAAAANADGNTVLTRAERETYNAIQQLLVSRLADPATRAEIAAHVEASKSRPQPDDKQSVAETLLWIDAMMAGFRTPVNLRHGWSGLGKKHATEGWGPNIRSDAARVAKLFETFDAERASEQRRLARAEQRRQHDDDDDKTPVVVASAPAPTGGDDTPDTPPAPGGGETLTPLPGTEGPFGPGDDPFGPGGEPEDDFGPGGAFDVGGEDDFGSEG